MNTEEEQENLGNCLCEFIDDGSNESHRYSLARRTMLEMLKDRGYAVPSSDISVSLQEFRNKHGQSPDIDALRISALHKDDPSNKLPRMSQKDAIARYYGLEKGQVVKMTYSGELTQLHVTYRCVW